MTSAVNRVIEEIKELSVQEKSLVAQCLLSSLDPHEDKKSSKEWAEIAKKRYEELSCGKVEAVSWDSIKKQIL